MASLVPNNPFDTSQQKFAGTGDVAGQITGGAMNGKNWDFMDQQGKVLTSVPYDTFVKDYQNSTGVVRPGTTSVNGVPVYDFNSGANGGASFKGPAPMPSFGSNYGGSEPASFTPTAPQDKVFRPKPVDPGIVSSAMTQQPTTNGGLPSNVGTSAPTTPNVATYAPTTRQVNQSTDTVAGQVDSILSKDSPLMARARTLATQQMAQRGLVNSSMAQGAGVAAMIDRATPIAAQDASTYNQVASDNMGALNTSGQFNASELNKFGLQTGAQQFQAGESALDRTQQATLQANEQTFQSGENSVQRGFQERMAVLEQSGLDYRQAREVASRETLFQLEQQGINNRFDQELALKSDMFNAEQTNAERRQIIQNNADLERLGIQINANRQDMPTSFAAGVSNNVMQGVNAILSDGNLTPASKKQAVDNLVNSANAQLGWAATFFKTPIPLLGSPGVTG